MSNDARMDSDVLAEAKARAEALAAQLSARPVEGVVGLIDATGKGGWPEQDGQWTLAFTFHCWKTPPGPMRTRPLTVTFTSSREQFDALWERIDPYAVLRIRARVAEESVIGVPRAELVEFHGPDTSDSELNQAAVDLQKPVVHHDSQFGELALDRRVNCYTGKTQWNGAVVALILKPDDSGSLDGALAVARTLWRHQERWRERVNEYAVQELLSLKNENWLDEEEVELSAEEFQARMTLESVTVMPHGSFDFWHDDGGLFCGHAIQISGNLRGSFKTLSDRPSY